MPAEAPAPDTARALDSIVRALSLLHTIAATHPADRVLQRELLEAQQHLREAALALVIPAGTLDGLEALKGTELYRTLTDKALERGRAGQGRGGGT